MKLVAWMSAVQTIMHPVFENQLQVAVEKDKFILVCTRYKFRKTYDVENNFEKTKNQECLPVFKGSPTPFVKYETRHEFNGNKN